MPSFNIQKVINAIQNIKRIKEKKNTCDVLIDSKHGHTKCIHTQKDTAQ